MSNRVTMKQLESVVARINRMTGSPVTTWQPGPSGRMVANIGNYHLDGAYGGWSLHRIVNDGGGISDVFRVGHVSKRELLSLMFAYIEGLSGPSPELATALDALKMVDSANDASFKDVWRNGGHDTQAVCIGCGGSGEHDDDCFMPVVKKAIKELEARTK